MKLSLLNGILFASILAFNVGCGKDKKSGGGNPAGITTNLYNAGLTQTSQQVLDKNRLWYDSTTEGFPMNGVATVRKTSKDYSSVMNCVQKKFLIINYQACSYNTSPTATQVLYNGFMTFTSNGAAINSKGNTELNAIFSGASGILINAIDLGQNASSLEFLSADGQTITTYIIDRGYNSQVNPLVKVTSTQTSKVVIETTVQ